MARTLSRRIRWAAVAATGGIVLGGAGVAVAADGSSPAPSPSSSAAPAPGDHRTHTPHIVGTLTATSGSTLTVTDPDGFQRAVHVTGSTTYTKDGKTVALSSITVGTRVLARGTVASDHTTLDATSVEVAPAGGPGGGPGGFRPGGPDGHGPRGGAPARPSDPPSGAPTPGSGGTPTPGAS